MIHDLDDSEQLPWLAGRGIALFRGHARIDGERRVLVDGRLLSARAAVVIATGTEAAIPPIPGLREAEPWTNRAATTAKEVPESLLIIGGGVVGVELAAAWSSLGARVTLIEGLGRVLAREEPFASEQVSDALRARGVEVHVDVKATAVERVADGFRLTTEGGATFAAQRLLVAVGRRPLTGDLGLEVVGLEPGSPIAVDDQLRVPGHGWLYAVGDVNGRSLLTHMGKYQGRIAADAILGREARAREDGPGAPRVVFTDPQVAAVGLTLAGALEHGIRATAVDQAMAATAGASFHGRGASGTARIVIDEDRRILVGATFTGPDVADFLHAATIAIVARVGLEDLWHAVPSFPTRSEIWLKLLEEYGL